MTKRDEIVCYVAAGLATLALAALAFAWLDQLTKLAQ
jgi:hypothetical protein